MPPDPPREQGPRGLATPTQINATPTSKTVENPVFGPWTIITKVVYGHGIHVLYTFGKKGERVGYG